MLPIIKPGIIAGALFAFLVSFDEIVVANFVSGLESTLPKKMFDHIRFELNPVLAAIATLLIAVTTIFLLVAFRLTWRPASSQATSGAMKTQVWRAEPEQRSASSLSDLSRESK